MNILRCHITGFGKLKNYSLDFQSGLNVIFAANEGGKSTLQRFLIGLLYGQLRSDLRIQRRLDPWVEQYKPWHAPDYGGILWCSLADGREVEIHRAFGKEETRIEIRTSAGEDITNKYEQQRNGEVLFARFHLGMPKELFESVGVIREAKITEINGRETIRDRIANLSQSGDEELSLRQSLEKIQLALDAIGSERAPTKPYKQAQDLLQALQSEKTALEERRAQYQIWIEERSHIAGEIIRLERALSRAQAAALAARRRETAATVKALEEIGGDIERLQAEIQSLGGRADFPADRLEELNHLAGAQDSIAKRLKEARSTKEAAFARLEQANADKQGLASYAGIAASAEAEKITEWFVSYLSLSLQKDGAQKSLARLNSEAATLSNNLDGLCAALKDPEIDWQRAAREAAEDEQAASQNCSALAENITHEKTSNVEFGRKTLHRRLLAGLLLVLSAGAAASRLFAGLADSLHIFEIGLGFVFAVCAAILLVAASKSAKAGRQAKQNLQTLEEKQNRIREEGSKKRKQINQVVADSGFQNIDEFLSAAKQSEQSRQKLEDLQTRSAEYERQLAQLQAQSDDIYRLLKEGLAKTGLSCSTGNLKFQIDIFRANLRKFRELDLNYSNCVRQADALAKEDANLTNEFEQKSSMMHALLAEAQVDSPEIFREECRKRTKLLELLDKESSRTREFQRLCGNLSLQEWKDRLHMLKEQPIHPPAEDYSAVEKQADQPDASEPFLPYQPSVAEAEEEEKRIATELFSAREEYARTAERVTQAFQNCRQAPEIEEDLAVAELNFAKLDKNRQALGIALEMIETLSRQQQEVLAPQLNAAVEQRFIRLCGRRYEEVKIDPDFQIWLRESSAGELRLAEHLSRGAQDQIYFAMRFGLLDLVANSDEPCPSLLDEPFAAYDQARLGEAMQILKEEAERRQLFLFTCREDVRDLAQQQGAKVIRLTNYD